MANTQLTPFDPKALRRALGNFATGITVITTTGADGTKAGMTANSFNSVSLDPPLVLWSIMKDSPSWPIYKDSTHFAVNILAADQIELSNHFARPSDDKFAGISYEVGEGGAPLLQDCAARFQCETHEFVDGGDHWIMIGKVVAFDDIGRSPLIYHQGTYSVVLPHSRFPEKQPEAQPEAVQKLQDKLSNNYFYLMTQAIRGYQEKYQPQQLSTGLRTSEARMLMILEFENGITIDALTKEVNMPKQELQEAAAILQRKNLIKLEGEASYCLTELGVEQAETLWKISTSQQEEIFANFSDDELATFRKVLNGLMG